mmetsp:Transcript_4841/g.9439  ORF Transcript_4841/g.9439 Transcript_4841/m.9439 type:complete len:226 (-) Transcript_4841:7-684(-)
MSSSLPSGYQKLTDPNSGRPYYVNLVTGQTSWTPPAEETNHLQKSGSLPAGWEERVDPTTGRTFYIDHVNKKTSWEHPGQPAAAPRPSAYEEPSRSHRQPASRSQSGSQSVSTLERDAQLARELAAQWDLESEPSAKNESDADAITSGTTLKDWAKDDDTTHCFLTGTKFTVVRCAEAAERVRARKHMPLSVALRRLSLSCKSVKQGVESDCRSARTAAQAEAWC